jgi:hypothetical protein
MKYNFSRGFAKDAQHNIPGECIAMLLNHDNLFPTVKKMQLKLSLKSQGNENQYLSKNSSCKLQAWLQSLRDNLKKLIILFNGSHFFDQVTSDICWMFKGSQRHIDQISNQNVKELTLVPMIVAVVVRNTGMCFTANSNTWMEQHVLVPHTTRHKSEV